MNRKIARYIIIILFILFVGVAYIFLMDKAPLIGIYDPHHTLKDEARLSLESVFFSWDDDAAEIKRRVGEILSNNRIPIVTLEPWYSEGQSSKELLKNVALGKYDGNIDQVCATLSEFQQPIWIRWGHEMELKNFRYPWSNTAPDDFVASYRYFVDKCRERYSQFSFIWSPAGEIGLDDYWPGEEYVDYVGLSIYSFDEWELENVGYQRSFVEIFGMKYDRVVGYHKPIIIAELGVTGDENTQRRWIQAAADSLSTYSQLYALVYFNSQDTEGVWGENINTPDWQISQSSLSPLLELAE